MRIAISLFLAFFLIFAGVEAWNFYERAQTAQADLETVQEELHKAKVDSDQISSDRDFYSNPANLEKDLRSRFNYRTQDEQMMVLVPTASSTDNEN